MTEKIGGFSPSRLYWADWEKNMNNRKLAAFGAAFFLGGLVSTTASAQTFQSYRCADGTQFIVGFFQYDSRAHLQLDGKAVTLARRLALSGSRYSGSGVTMTISKAGVTTLKHGKRPVVTCEPA
jgi:membrane-bound inhibitor of C-type lysozyme